MEPLDVLCPRCGEQALQQFYGPCADCRAQLRQHGSDRPSSPVEPVEYEPKMNVTPNAVALRDD